jgi:hypothetical protein
LIGSDATIDTGAFLASTLDADNQEFLNASDMTFTGDANSNVYLYNYGTITADTGDVILLGYQIYNQGTITAANGTSAQGAGVEIVLQPSSTDNRILIVAHPDPLSTVMTGIDDGSTISALRSELAADGNAYQVAIQHEGWIDAIGTPGLAVSRCLQPLMENRCNGVVQQTWQLEVVLTF